MQASDPRLTVVSRLGVEATEQTWLRPLLSAWRGARPSDSRVVGYETICKELSPHDPCEPGHRALPSQVVVVLASEAGDEHDLYRLLDALRRSITPAVLVINDQALGGFSPQDAEDLGVPVLAWDTEPAEIATRLATLMSRQPLLDAMSREVRLAQLSQRSIAGELDKLHKELHEAAHMQQQFVQKGVPYTPGLNVGVIFRPASYVSGDLFDVERLDEHHVAVFLADAVGHGVPAAMLTLFISRALPKIDGVGERSRIVPPGEAMARLNREFCSRPGGFGGGSRFATAVYMVVDTRTMSARIAGAGHPAPLVVGGPSGNVERVESEGPLVGVFPDADFPETTVDLGGSRTMVMFTDGFETAFPEAKSSGRSLKMPTDLYVERLARLAGASHGPGGFAEAMRAFETELDSQIGSLHRPDDVTALVISRAADEDAARRAA